MASLTICDDNHYKVDSSVTIILKNSIINIDYEISNKNCSILVFNDVNCDVIINESGSIDNSNVKINYLQLDKYNLEQNTKINVSRNSKLNINNTCLGTNDKHIVFDLFNLENDSEVDITNNIVCLDQANFTLDCIGTIVKGAKRSKCHQKSNCLTIGCPKMAKVLPVLNIDENDVEASHSLSSGTIDEEILFYMNSRGLNSKDALSLILKSYLMPSDNYYDEFDDGKQIQLKAIGKVDEICSM